METQWIYKPQVDEFRVQDLAGAINVNSHLATLLLQRGVGSFEAAKNYFRPLLSQLPNPFGMTDMDLAVQRLVDAIGNGEKILFYGDYDVDGTTSVALMVTFFREQYPNIGFYIPDRYAEGYGLSLAGVDHARKNGFSLIITLDCGIKAHQQISKAKEWGIDVMVCDHHRPEGTLPPALAILNPQREDCDYPSKELSGCGVGFKLLQAFCQHQGLDEQEALFPLLDLVTLAIAADIVPIVNENRILAYYGLKVLEKSPRPGIQALLKVAGVQAPFTISDLVFYVGPRINAAGRLAHAHEAVRLLLSNDAEDAERRAHMLHEKNQERKQVDQSITEEALAMIAEGGEAKSTVLFKEDWHKGIVGIVASRCIEQYYRPTIILTSSNQKATGSARSVPGFDVYEALHECEDLLEQFGGHTYAAGLTLALDKVDAFRSRFEQVVAKRIGPEGLVPQLEVDMEVPLEVLTPKFYAVLKQMAPFGPGNPEPILVSRNLKVLGQPRLLKEKHLKATITDDNPQSGAIDIIGFNMAEFFPLLESGRPFSLAYALQENHWRGQTSLQLMAKDIRPE